MPGQPVESVLRYIQRLAPRAGAAHLTDVELLNCLAQGRDESAFEALIRRHGPLVWRVCWHNLYNTDDAEDAFQATFFVLARKSASIRKGESLGSWLYGVAARIARKARARRLRRQMRELDCGHPAAVSPPADAGWRDLEYVVQQEVLRLPAKYRIPIVLCYFQGKTNEEAARQLSWPSGTVKVRLARARALLHKRLLRRGVTVSAAVAALALDASATYGKVPARLMESTVRAALLGSGSGSAAGPAIVLAKEALRCMLVAQLKLASVAFLTAGILTAGLGALVFATRDLEPVIHEVGKMQTDVPSTQTPARAAAESPNRTDRYGDPLPAGALARLGSTRLRHGFITYALAFAPNGKWLASAGGGRCICLWDPVTGKQLHQLAGAQHAYAVTFSPGSSLVAGAYEVGKIRVWDATTGSEIRQLVGSEDGVPQALAFSPDGTMLACGGYDDLVRLCDVATGREIRQLRGHWGGVKTVAFSPDGKTLASGSMDKTIRFWDPATGRERMRLSGNTGYVLHVLYSRDGNTLISAGQDETIRIWDIAGGKQLRTLAAPRATGSALALSPDGKLLASGHLDGLVRLWDPSTGKEVRQWQASAARITALDFSPDGTTLASGALGDSGVHLWDPATGRQRLPFAGPGGAVEQLAFAADGSSLLLACRDRTLMRWDWVGDRETILDAQKPSLRILRFSPGGKLLADAGFRDGSVFVRKCGDASKPRELGQHADFINALVFSGDGRLLASGGDDALIHVWDLHAGKKLQSIKSNEAIGSLAFSPDGKTLASGASRNNAGALPTDPAIHLFDVATGKEVNSLKDAGEVFQLLFSPDGRLLASGSGHGHKGPRVWDLVSGKQLVLPISTAECYSIAFSRDGRLMAWGSSDRENIVRIVEIASRQEVLRFSGHHSGIGSLGFSPNGRLLASGGGDSTVLVWDLTGRCRAGRSSGVKLSSRELETCWTDLADTDAAKAYRAVQSLALAPSEQVVPLLRERLHSEPPADPKQVAGWIRDLDGNEFGVRERAGQQLKRLGHRAEATLRQAVASKPTPEVGRRLQQLLNQLDLANSPDQLRQVRAVAALESSASPQAIQLLKHLTEREAGAFLARESQASLERLLTETADEQ
jgi:RNA polymerase sigma factor (sigma-70 family)